MLTWNTSDFFLLSPTMDDECNRQLWSFQLWATRLESLWLCWSKGTRVTVKVEHETKWRVIAFFIRFVKVRIKPYFQNPTQLVVHFS